MFYTPKRLITPLKSLLYDSVEAVYEYAFCKYWGPRLYDINHRLDALNRIPAVFMFPLKRAKR